MEGKCPVNHSGSTEGECPVKEKSYTIVNHENQFETGDEEISFDEFENKDPNEKEFKELKSIMTTLKRFYEHGTAAKKEQYEDAVEALKALNFDMEMAKDQLNAMDKATADHLKQKQYTQNLEEELRQFEEKKKRLEEQEAKYKDLYEWSKVIVKVCEWLEQNLDEYGVTKLGLKIENYSGPARKLSEEESKEYSKGLAEITYNLKESYDFFKAAVDGRLLKFLYEEEKIIQKQLEVIRKYPKDNDRRIYIERELVRDLEYTQQRIKSGESKADEARRQKMLRMHTEYLRLLTFLRKKWGLLSDFDDSEINPNPDFTQTFVL